MCVLSTLHSSYLRGLVPVYNSVVVKDLIEPLRAKADGTTSVPMKTEFSRISLLIQSFNLCSMLQCLPIALILRSELA